MIQYNCDAEAFFKSPNVGEAECGGTPQSVLYRYTYFQEDVGRFSSRIPHKKVLKAHIATNRFYLSRFCVLSHKTATSFTNILNSHHIRLGVLKPVWVILQEYYRFISCMYRKKSRNVTCSACIVPMKILQYLTLKC